ncbi:site-2 protease family protein [Microvirga tunisiensis]|uniref:Site-2 protease family protein n=1 Tax=Microvirga tunisiensis TaxID=2108360 RepID=A0A5N7MLI1_9HYPH|nr:site-2 protease family protein [Microvirga tunisiensis]MPR09712.1 site-2 protease family protein [Microvirga tunisiensis]MPR27932.1 site-2 protease family protein [Microvirga tunisiensis]
MDLPSTIYTASTWIVPILIAITFHEAAHAFAAWKLGDDTAHRMGRVTFNPFKHVDPFGTVLLPALLFLTKAPFLFGWAKPVPVAFQRLGKPRRDMALVAMAGPLTNIGLALVSAALLRMMRLLPEEIAPWFVQTLYQSILLNLILAIFNMFPIPPLDGSRVLMSLLPKALARQYAKLERFGFLILLGIIFLLPILGRQTGTDLNLFRWAVAIPLAWLMPIFRAIAGASQ